MGGRPPMALGKKIVRLARIKAIVPAKSSLEAYVLSFASQGAFGVAASKAVKAQLSRGLPVVFLQGLEIVKKHPDGTEEVLSHVRKATYTLPKSVERF